MARLKYHAQSLSSRELIGHYGDILIAIQTNPKISGPLRARGWTDEKTQNVQDLLDAFDGLHKEFDQARRDRNATSETLEAEVDAFQTGTYYEHAGLLDAVYSDAPERRAQLGLEDRPRMSRGGTARWTREVIAFYERILNDPQALVDLEDVKLTRDELQGALDEVTRLDDMARERDVLSTERQDLRDARDAKRDELIREMRRLQKMCLAILGEENQALEDVGYVISTTPAPSGDGAPDPAPDTPTDV